MLNLKGATRDITRTSYDVTTGIISMYGLLCIEIRMLVYVLPINVCYGAFKYHRMQYDTKESNKSFEVHYYLQQEVCHAAVGPPPQVVLRTIYGNLCIRG